MIQRYLECGKIVSTHGVKGDVRVENYCDTPAVLAGLPTVYRKHGQTYFATRVERGFAHGDMAVLKLEGISDMDAAARLRGTVLYAAREDLPLPEGAHFIAELIGLPVIDSETGETYGHIKEVINRGASDIYVIKTSKGEVLLPAVEAFIREVDIEKWVKISPIGGFFDDEI